MAQISSNINLRSGASVADPAPDSGAINNTVLRQTDFTDALSMFDNKFNTAVLGDVSQGIGVAALRKLAASSPQDASFSAAGIYRSRAEELITAAQTLTDPQYSSLLNNVSAGRTDNNKQPVLLPQDIKNYLQNNAAGDTAADTGTTYKQGDIGDCWVLSSLGALMHAPLGSNTLSEIVKVNLNGTYNVKLPGTNEPIKVTPDDILNAIHDGKGAISTQNPSVAVLEIALRRYWQQTEGRDIGDGGKHEDIAKLLSLLSGRQAQTVAPSEGLAALQKNPALSVVFGSGVDDGGTAVPIDDPSSQGGHAFFVKGINKEQGMVEYYNPWDTEKVRSMPLAEAAKVMMATVTV